MTYFAEPGRTRAGVTTAGVTAGVSEGAEAAEAAETEGIVAEDKAASAAASAVPRRRMMLVGRASTGAAEVEDEGVCRETAGAGDEAEAMTAIGALSGGADEGVDAAGKVNSFD